MLPCQHSFCQEPCMDGLQDYARRQIKCPECRAEHRIPFQGIQTYPTNVTLQRFLELHQSITGEEPDPVPSMMERCGVCGEKSMVTRCCHCEKKVCQECKDAHLDILKREISRICHQVRRALNRLQDALTQTERSVERLTVNSVHIRDEIEEIVRRFIRDIKTQEEKMLKELEQYSQIETKTLSKLKEDLEVEYNNMKDNCDLVEKNILDPDKQWNDVELVECKDIFVKTLDFLRNFDGDSVDYTRGMRFIQNTDLDALRRNLINFGELKLPTSEEVQAQQHQRATSPLQYSASSLSIPQQNMLMRSQSDHRLSAQFARRESQLTELASTRSGRLGTSGLSDTEKDSRGERSTSPSGYGRSSRRDEHRRYGQSVNDPDSSSRNRFLRDSDSYRSNWSRGDEDSFPSSGSQFKSRFMREKGVELGNFDEHDSFDVNSISSRSVRFDENLPPPQAVKVFDTDAAPRGPLSGIVRIGDTSHYMERSHENEARARVEKARQDEESLNPPAPPPTRPTPAATMRRPPSRQVSEDEIEKQKKANQAASAVASAASAASAVSQPPTSPTYGSVNPVSLTNQSSQPATQTVPASPTTLNKNMISSTPSGPLSDVNRLISRRTGSLRDDDERSTLRGTTDSNTGRNLRESEDDDDSDVTSISRGLSSTRRRRGSLGLDEGTNNKDSSRSSQVPAVNTGHRQVVSSNSGEEVSLSKEDKEMMKMQDSLKNSTNYTRRSTSTSGGYQYTSTLGNRSSLSRQSSIDRDDLYHHLNHTPTSGYSSNNSATNRLNRGQSPMTARRSSDISLDKRSSSNFFSSSLRSRSPSLDRELKSDSLSNRRLLSRANSVEEQGRYSFSSRPNRFTPNSRVYRSSTVSSLGGQAVLSSTGRYSFDSDSGTSSPSRPNRSRPSSPSRYGRTSALTSESSSNSPTFRRYNSSHLVDSSKAIFTDHHHN